MRPPARLQDPLRAPLNEILGSEGAVRVLRVLARGEDPMGRAQVARRAVLNASGVRRILDRLAATGLTEVVGSGRNQAVRLRDRHPLSRSLRALFRTEREVFERTVQAARRAFLETTPPATAIWVESPSARSPGTVDVGVLAEPSNLERATSAVRDYLEAIEQELAIHFVVHGYTEADRVVADQHRLENVTLLHGWIPVRWRQGDVGPIVTHRVVEDHARLLAGAVAELLPNDPSLVQRTIEWIDQRMESSSARDTHELSEWRRVLSQLSTRQVQALLTEHSERADRLRQSLPFLETLSASERAELLRRDEA